MWLSRAEETESPLNAGGFFFCGASKAAKNSVLYHVTTSELAEKLGSANLSVRLANFEVIVCLTFCHPEWLTCLSASQGWNERFVH
jgi:hypothetical protein